MSSSVLFFRLVVCLGVVMLFEPSRPEISAIELLPIAVCSFLSYSSPGIKPSRSCCMKSRLSPDCSRRGWRRSSCPPWPLPFRPS